MKCDAPLGATAIAVLTLDNIAVMRDEYIESTQLQDSTPSLKTIIIPKLDNENWLNFEYMVVKCFSRALGRDKVPLTYIIRENDVINLGDSYEI